MVMKKTAEVLFRLPQHLFILQYSLYFFIEAQSFLRNLNILSQLLLRGLRADRPVPEPAARLHPDIR